MNISKFSKTSGTVRIRIHIFPCGSESRRPFLMRILIINTAFKCFFKTIHTSIWYNHGWNYFFRAKTVRIGKWRWPPPKEDGTAATAEGFFEFKMRKMKEKGWSNNFKPELSRIFSWSRLRFSWILNMVEGQRPLSKVADRALLLRGGCAFTTFLLPSSRLLKIKQNCLKENLIWFGIVGPKSPWLVQVGEGGGRNESLETSEEIQGIEWDQDFTHPELKRWDIINDILAIFAKGTLSFVSRRYYVASKVRKHYKHTVL